MQSDLLDDSSGDGDASEERLKGMLAEIQDILDTQHRDSFSSLLAENCLVSVDDDDTLQVREGRHQYIFHKPAVMMCATDGRGACHIEHKSGWYKSEIQAKVEATQSALEVLRKQHCCSLIETRGDSSGVQCEEETDLEWPIEPDEPPCTRQMSDWETTISAHYLENRHGIRFPVAILTAGSFEQYRFKHQLRFRLDDGSNTIVRVTTKQFSWTHGHADIVKKFHQVISGRDSNDLDAVAVLVKEEHLDVERMELVVEQGSQIMLAHEVPVQLFWLCFTIGRLSAWHNLLAVGAPTVPAPSPLKMHAILDDRLQESSECAMLALLGKGILQLMVAVSMFKEYPLETASQLQERTKDLTKVSRLSKLMAASPLPHYAERQVTSPEDAAEMIEALVGAHFDEADFYAVNQFWKRLLGSKDEELKESVGHLQESWNYKGRTHTYTELHEDWWHQDGESGFLVLKVLYEDCEMMYRCVGAGPEERKGLKDTWHALTYKQDLHTFTSSILKDPESGDFRDMPTKIVKWFRGMRLEALMTGKMKTDAPVLTYEELSEDVDKKMEIIGDNGVTKTHIETSVVLCVKYEDRNSWLYYVRSESGGLGYEAAKDASGNIVRKTLGYSELHKGLLSNAFPKKILPKKVAAWLSDCTKNLSELLPPPVKDKDNDLTDNVKIFGEDVIWQQGEQQYVCRVEPGGSDRLVWRAVDEAWDGTWQALIWVQEDRQWKTRSGLDGIAVPFMVWNKLDDKLSCHRQREDVKVLFPQSTNALRYIENVFNNYTFQVAVVFGFCVRFLSQATHNSLSRICNQRTSYAILHHRPPPSPLHLCLRVWSQGPLTVLGHYFATDFVYFLFVVAWAFEFLDA